MARMNFEQIPVSVHPAYTWLWNGHITRDGIKEQLDEMYDSGVRAFYILGEPENFRPFKRKTYRGFAPASPNPTGSYNPYYSDKEKSQNTEWCSGFFG